MRTLAISFVVSCIACIACGDAPAQDGPAPAVEGRVNAVMAKSKGPTFADLCDVAPSKAKPKTFTWPALLAAAPASKAPYRWINVWATWCKPCIEELPLLDKTLAAWRAQGHDITLTLVSVDGDAEAPKTFMTAHPGVPSTLQISDATQATPWLTSLGLQSGSSIPVHVLVDANDQLLCARSGGLSESDLERFHHALFP
jgi:thiol-disulfide isomerase/thioredoxin